MRAMHAGWRRRLLGALLMLVASSTAPAEVPDEASRLRLERPGLGPEDYNNLAGQICRTDLPVEKEELAILLAFPDGKETVRGRALLYGCLAERHYDPATPRIEQALGVADRYEVDVALG